MTKKKEKEKLGVDDTVLALFDNLVPEAKERVADYIRAWDDDKNDDVDDMILSTMTRAVRKARLAFEKEIDKDNWDVQIEFECQAIRCDGDGRPHQSVGMRYHPPKEEEDGRN